MENAVISPKKTITIQKYYLDKDSSLTFSNANNTKYVGMRIITTKKKLNLANIADYFHKKYTEDLDISNIQYIRIETCDELISIDLSEFTYVRDLRISQNNKLQSIENKNLPQNIKKLYIANNNLKLFTNIDLPELDYLYISENKLKNISDINFPNLIKCVLYVNKLSIFDNINMPNVGDFVIKSNTITTFNNINLESVSSVDINCAELLNINNLNITEIKMLETNNIKIITNFPNIFNNIIKVNIFNADPNIQIFDIISNAWKIRLNECKFTGEHAYIFDQNISFPKLKYLSLYGIKNIKHMVDNSATNVLFPKLEKIFCAHSDIETLIPPRLAPNIIYLDCTSNKIKTIENYPELLYLSVTDNNITKYTPNEKIKELYIKSNDNFKFNNSDSFPNLQRLCANISQINSSDILNIFDLKKIVNLDITDDDYCSEEESGESYED